jgi:hypothetical protein
VSIAGCVVVAVEGTHASGKTTLAHALTAHYRARGVLVDVLPEPARTSPFVEQVVIHGRGAFDLDAEVDLFGAHLSTTLRAARHQQLLICDKTVVNVLAYARLLLDARPGGRDASVLDAMTAFCRAWAPGTYDAVFWLPDAFDGSSDPLRARVDHLQDQTSRAVRAACTAAGIDLQEVPAGLDLPGRVTQLARRVDELLAARTGYRAMP